MTIKQYHRIKLRELRKGNLAVLDHMYLSKTPSIKEIRVACARAMHVEDVSLNGKTRKREVVLAKQMAHALTREIYGKRYSLEYIGAKIGGMDHATVRHSIKTINNLIDTDKNFKKMYEYFKNEHFFAARS